MTPRTFYGKYRGIVTDNQDPQMQGRIRARVPDVTGDQDSGWAMPCMPFHGFFALPTKGSGVWIEFEQGDPEYPIWSGCWWGSVAELKVLPPPPAPAPLFSKIALTTEQGHSILLDDTPGTGGITLETATGQKIVLSVQGIEIDNGLGASITLQATKVAINKNALEVLF